MKKKSQKRAGNTRSSAKNTITAQVHMKFAVSMPNSDFDQMEAVRKKLGISRSRFVVLSARRWFEDIEEKQAVLSYTRGYEAIPEDAELMAVMERIQSIQLTEESW